MENNEKEVLFSVSHLKKYFQVGNHATLKACLLYTSDAADE